MFLVLIQQQWEQKPTNNSFEDVCLAMAPNYPQTPRFNGKHLSPSTTFATKPFEPYKPVLRGCCCCRCCCCAETAKLFFLPKGLKKVEPASVFFGFFLSGAN